MLGGRPQSGFTRKTLATPGELTSPQTWQDLPKRGAGTLVEIPPAAAKILGTKSRTMADLNRIESPERSNSAITLSTDMLASGWKSLKSKIKKNKNMDEEDFDFDQDEPPKDTGEFKDDGPEFDFSEADTPDLVFVKQEGSRLPVVKGGTAERLIDRLTPEKYPGKVTTYIYT